MRHTLRLFLGLVAAVLLVAAPAQGQHREERSAQPFFPCHLPAPEAVPGLEPVAGAHDGYRAPDTHTRGSGQASARFEVTYVGFSAQAQAAFQAAVDVWAEHLVSAVPIRIRAEWKDLGGNLLGSAGPYLTRNFAGAPVAGTWYPYPLADALAGRDLDPSRPDIEASFNSGYANWYLGTDGNGPPNQVELFTVVLHELGHGLGFIGSASVENGVGSFGLNQAPGVPFVFDRFAVNDTNCPLLNAAIYPSPSTALGQVLRDEVFFRGRAVVGVHGEPAPLYTPSTWNQGSSYSHFDERAFPASEPDGLMTPLIAPGEKKDSPGPLLCASLQDLGWTLAPACADLVPDDLPVLAEGECSPPPDPIDDEPFVLAFRGPNPFGVETSLSLTVRDRQRVQAWLFDAAGRRLGTLLDATIQSGGEEVLRLDGAALPSGVYFVRVVGESFSETATVTSIR